MQWIHNFTANKIPFYVYKLEFNDGFIYTDNDQFNRTIVILHGILFMLKIFTNGEQLCIAILSKNNIINIHNNYRKTQSYYYKAIAIENTWILSFKLNCIYNTSPVIIKNLIKSYSLTLYQYEIQNQILIHKEVKNRLNQIIIYLVEQFGYIENQNIVIRCHIDQSILALILGTNKITINKLVKRLNRQMLIKHYKNKIIYIQDKQ